MTGFGKAVTICGNKQITAEIKSLNSKQMDLLVRMPQAYRDHELDIRNMVAEKLLRGKVELYISCEAAEGNAAMSINMPLLKLYKSQIDNAAATAWFMPLPPSSVCRLFALTVSPP